MYEAINDNETCIASSTGKHQWVKIRDAEGNFSEAHLVRYFDYYRCICCGDEIDDKPADYEEPFLEPDPFDGPFEDRDCAYWERH